MKRERGIVVGSSCSRGNKTTWAVRVKDQGSEYHGRKFVVTSLHEPDVTPAPGLGCTFVLAQVDDKQGHKPLRAIDLRLVGPGDKEGQ